MSRREPTQGGPALRVPIGVFLVVVVVVGALWVATNKAAASVVFTEPANAPSPRPGFLPPSTVTAIARTPVHTIGHVVSGDTVGLYGGGESNTCDAAAIGAFLAANPAMALAWAQALLIPPSDISLYLASFTALTLRTDTAVTNHGYETELRLRSSPFSRPAPPCSLTPRGYRGSAATAEIPFSCRRRPSPSPSRSATKGRGGPDSSPSPSP
jgi:hypothetical protein